MPTTANQTASVSQGSRHIQNTTQLQSEFSFLPLSCSLKLVTKIFDSLYQMATSSASLVRLMNHFQILNLAYFVNKVMNFLSKQGQHKGL